MADITIEDLSPDAELRRLTGETGVFVGGEDDLAAAKNRYEAQQAYAKGRATPEQVALLQDLDRVLQGASRLTPVQAAPPSAQRQHPVPPPAPPPVEPRTWRSEPSGNSSLERLRLLRRPRNG